MHRAVSNVVSFLSKWRSIVRKGEVVEKRNHVVGSTRPAPQPKPRAWDNHTHLLPAVRVYGYDVHEQHQHCKAKKAMQKKKRKFPTW